MFGYHRTQDWTKVCLCTQISSQANFFVHVQFWPHEVEWVCKSLSRCVLEHKEELVFER